MANEAVAIKPASDASNRSDPCHPGNDSQLGTPSRLENSRHLTAASLQAPFSGPEVLTGPEPRQSWVRTCPNAFAAVLAVLSDKRQPQRLDRSKPTKSSASTGPGLDWTVSKNQQLTSGEHPPHWCQRHACSARCSRHGPQPLDELRRGLLRRATASRTSANPWDQTCFRDERRMHVRRRLADGAPRLRCGSGSR